jgi:predicted RNA-binding Zn ribbon-like protein
MLPGPIPSTLSAHPCVDFVNSRFNEHTGAGTVHDRLPLEPWRRWFLERWGFSCSPALTATRERELRALRELLRRLLETRRTPSLREIAALNRYLSRGRRSWRLVVEGRRCRVVPRWQHDGWPAVMALVAASYAELLASGELRRVRVCANPDCSFVFHDESRNRSRRWCDVSMCGNLVNVRRHRQATRR